MRISQPGYTVQLHKCLEYYSTRDRSSVGWSEDSNVLPSPSVQVPWVSMVQASCRRPANQRRRGGTLLLEPGHEDTLGDNRADLHWPWNTSDSRFSWRAEHVWRRLVPEIPRFLNGERTSQGKGIESGKRKGDKTRGGNQCLAGSAINQTYVLLHKIFQSDILSSNRKQKVRFRA